MKHTDGKSWVQAGKTLSVWTIATTMVTVFKILADHTKATLEPLYGPLLGILVSDTSSSFSPRAAVLSPAAPSRRGFSPPKPFPLERRTLQEGGLPPPCIG